MANWQKRRFRKPVTPTLDLYSAVMIAEGVIEADEKRQLEAWQFLVDSGVVWKLQGSFGRTARYLIDLGFLKPAPDQSEG